MTTADRRGSLLATLPDDVDALLVTKLVNVRYLTGFTGSNGAVLLRRDGTAVLATDGRYEEQAKTQAPDLHLHITRTLGPDLVAQAVAASARRIAIERHHVTLAAYDVLLAAAAGAELVGAGEPIEELRVRKNDEEVAALSEACAVTDRAFAAVLQRLRPGVTERDVAWTLLETMRADGAEGPAFDAIVAFGPHSAIPHHRPTDRALTRGDLVKLDFGARVRGYHADMTRTVVCGSAADWQRELHDQVAAVQQQCRSATVVGADPVELDALSRRLIADRGHELVHGLGHGVGLEVHEQPFLGPLSSAAKLADRVPVTVEPGIYLPGRGGVRIEDTVLVTGSGPLSLTESERALVEV